MNSASREPPILTESESLPIPTRGRRGLKLSHTEDFVLRAFFIGVGACHLLNLNGDDGFAHPAKLFGEWRSSDEVCKIWRCEPLNVSNAKIPKNVVNRRHRFLTNDGAKASFESVLECQPRKCG